MHEVLRTAATVTLYPPNLAILGCTFVQVLCGRLRKSRKPFTVRSVSMFNQKPSSNLLDGNFLFALTCFAVAVRRKPMASPGIKFLSPLNTMPGNPANDPSTGIAVIRFLFPSVLPPAAFTSFGAAGAGISMMTRRGSQDFPT
jgi:hypothetical protein